MIDNDWDNILEKEFAKAYFIKLQSFLEVEYATKTIFPPRKDVYNAFELCPFQNVKVVVLGQDPYHNFNQSHGLAFSVKKGNKIPPSLRNIFKERKSDLGLEAPFEGDLTSWAREGVLLLNTILTVEAHKPLSHQKIGWEQFTDQVILKLNEDNRPKVFVLWGNNAQKKASIITNPHHLIIRSSHPSPLAARHSFFGSQVFSRTNDYLIKTNQLAIDFNLD